MLPFLPIPQWLLGEPLESTVENGDASVPTWATVLSSQKCPSGEPAGHGLALGSEQPLPTARVLCACTRVVEVSPSSENFIAPWGAVSVELELPLRPVGLAQEAGGWVCSSSCSRFAQCQSGVCLLHGSRQSGPQVRFSMLCLLSLASHRPLQA